MQRVRVGHERHRTRVWVDEVEITGLLRRVELVIDAAGVPTFQCTFNPAAVSVDIDRAEVTATDVPVTAWEAQTK